MSAGWQDDLDVARAALEAVVLLGDGVKVKTLREGLEALDSVARFIWELIEGRGVLRAIADEHCHESGSWSGPEGNGDGPHCHSVCSHVIARRALSLSPTGAWLGGEK